MRLRHALTVAVAMIAMVVCAGTAGASPSTVAQTVKKYERVKHRYEGTLAFFDSRRWMLAPRYEKCWQVPGENRKKVCRIARKAVKAARVHVANAERVIEKLTAVRGPIGSVSAWNCIYSYESGPEFGGWAAATGNGYYGGLQMDIAFQRAHGLDLYSKKGTANRWTAYEQMVVAERARRGVRTSWSNGRVVFWQDKARGYHPWPNTARYCGLL